MAANYFVLLGDVVLSRNIANREEYTALALIFAGKAIVRSEDKEKLSVYHLAGTMINTAYSILLAFIIKYIIGKITAFS